MTEPIAPALTPKEWATLGPDGVGHPILPSSVGDVESLDAEDHAKVIAIANFALPDTDPRKITWAMVDDLRSAANCIEWEFASDPDILVVRAIADALASYLPPRKCIDTRRTMVQPIYGGVVAFDCPSCKTGLNTSDARDQVADEEGIIWQGIVCPKCGKSFTFAASEVKEPGSSTPHAPQIPK